MFSKHEHRTAKQWDLNWAIRGCGL